MAEKKITPKAAASKSTKGGEKKAAATRVTKRALRRDTRKNLRAT